MRGEVPPLRLCTIRTGIIPAGAGRSATSSQDVRAKRDHPRGCGEKLMAAAHPGWCRGSSPRVRGEGVKPLRPSGRKGIIPAGAGKSVKRDSHQAILRDHPRGCGEKFDLDDAPSVREGSSPRVRGKAPFLLLPFRSAGIIPAGAGKSLRRSGSMTMERDHPRGCGEKFSSPAPTPPQLGSSPRVRGEGQLSIEAGLWGGIIPAGAGRSRS